jgi:hypothetical protein
MLYIMEAFEGQISGGMASTATLLFIEENYMLEVPRIQVCICANLRFRSTVLFIIILK